MRYMSAGIATAEEMTRLAPSHRYNAYADYASSILRSPPGIDGEPIHQLTRCRCTRVVTMEALEEQG